MLYNSETIEETKSKTLYEYAYEVVIDNPLNGTRGIKFKTATVQRDNTTGKEIYRDYRRTLSESYTENEVFDLYNPETGEVAGQMDYDTLFAAMYSLFFHVANKTDSP